MRPWGINFGILFVMQLCMSHGSEHFLAMARFSLDVLFYDPPGERIHVLPHLYISFV